MSADATVARKRSRSDASETPKREIIVILEQASLEIVKTKKGDFQLLNADDHRSVLAKHNRDPAECRPDILHQELMALLDSPLNKTGNLKVYIRSRQNVLIELHPSVRIPRTYKRFAGLFCQLLHKLKVKAADGNETLLKVVKNPYTRHLPSGSVCYGFSSTGAKYNPHHFAAALPEGVPIVFVIGAMATGSIVPEDHNIVEMVSISEFPLSGSTAINRLLGAIEQHWGIF
ncbi:Alpha/beta knot methyltransferase [Pelagophyceae sp. CCMP2097]|nr:Alpha/beta knot methyltransferase [Pelagophyceae sp. CCMP2097]